MDTGQQNLSSEALLDVFKLAIVRIATIGGSSEEATQLQKLLLERLKALEAPFVMGDEVRVKEGEVAEEVTIRAFKWTSADPPTKVRRIYYQLHSQNAGVWFFECRIHGAILEAAQFEKVPASMALEP